MMEKMQGYNPFQQALIDRGVEPQYIFSRSKGGKTYRYVEASYIVELLNQLFGYVWNWEVGDSSIRTFMGTKFIKETKQTVPEEKSFVVVKGTITVPVLNPNYNEANDSHENKYIWIKKESFGSHPLLGNDAETQGDAYKAAATDALKKCASMLGVAKNVYMSEEVAMYREQYNQMVELFKNNPDLEKLIHTFCEETMDYSTADSITPSNIVHFLSWIKERTASIEEDLDKLEIETQPLPETKPTARKLY